MLEISPSLQVSRAGLVAALNTIRKMRKPRSPGDALVSFADGKIALAVLGLTIRATAEGTWLGQAKIPIAFLTHLTKVPSSLWSDPVPIRVADGRFYIETFYIDCVWEQVEQNRIELPINVTLRRLLAMGFYHSMDAMDRSGLLNDYEDAVRRRDILITRAADILSPLGLTQDDVVRLVEASLRTEPIE